jgi:ATP-dependent protease ClpP protease subunit
MAQDEIIWADSSSGNSDPLTVEKVSTHIYFYSSVNQDRCLDLIKKIKNLDEDLRSERKTRSIPDDHDMVPIWLHIFSPGGDLFTGMAVSDQIKQIETPIYSIVEGYAASAATYISMSCTRRYIQPSAYMLVHQHSNMSFGKYEELKDEMKLNNMLMERYVKFYIEHSNMDEEEVREVLKRESWFDAEQALEKGLVDEVLQ